MRDDISKENLEDGIWDRKLKKVEDWEGMGGGGFD